MFWNCNLWNTIIRFFCMFEDTNTCMCRMSIWWKLPSKCVQKQHKYDGNQESVLLLLRENLRGNIPSLFFPQALCIILIHDNSKQIKIAGELLQMPRYFTALQEYPTLTIFMNFLGYSKSSSKTISSNKCLWSSSTDWRKKYLNTT